MAKDKLSKREIKYPELKSEIYGPENPITVEQAMSWLGWEDETNYVARMLEDFPDANDAKFKYGSDFDFVDVNNCKVRCNNNHGNRELQVAWANEIAQDILNLNWRLNGESIIIGRTGQVLSAQHRLIGLIFAWQKWLNCHKNHQWRVNWKFPNSPPTIQSFVSFGIEETPDVTRTLDNVRKRTLSDVLFANGRVFKSMRDRADRAKATRIVEYAVKFLWSRTGKDRKSLNAFSPRRTHSESIEFIENHPTILDYTESIFNMYSKDLEGKDSPKKWKETTSNVIHAGFATGLLYLMATSATDGDDYRNSDPPREGTDKKPVVNWSNAQRALDFWEELTGEMPSDVLRGLRLSLVEPMYSGDKDERLTLICKAWNMFLNGDDIPPEGIDIEDHLLQDDNTMEKYVAVHEIVGGLDIGPPEKAKKEKEDPIAEAVNEEEVEEHTEDQPSVPEVSSNGSKKKGKKKVESE